MRDSCMWTSDNMFLQIPRKLTAFFKNSKRIDNPDFCNNFASCMNRRPVYIGSRCELYIGVFGYSKKLVWNLRSFLQLSTTFFEIAKIHQKPQLLPFFCYTSVSQNSVVCCLCKCSIRTHQKRTSSALCRVILAFYALQRIAVWRSSCSHL